MTKNAAGQADKWAVGWVIRVLVIVIFAAAILVPLGGIPIIAVATRTDGNPEVSTEPVVISLGQPTPMPTDIPVTPTPRVLQVGIVVGHLGHDPGAVCPDGLQEVQVNSTIAQYVKLQGEAEGWQVELLDEFDDRLIGYQADVLLSIHADSCGFPEKTGFKLARAIASHIPDEEDRLVQCLQINYRQVTGLQFDGDTITPDMTEYHTFDEIAFETPAAIIETGFMEADRDLLVNQADLVAQGIVDGLRCFLEGLEQ